MTENSWLGVFRAVEERRNSLRMSQARLAQLAGVSRTKIVQMAQGIPLETRVKRIGLTRALQWSDDSIDRLLNGEEPLEQDSGLIDPNAQMVQAVDTVHRRLDRLGTKIEVLGSQIATLGDRIDALTAEITRMQQGPASAPRAALAAAAHDGNEPAPRGRARQTPRGGRAEQGEHLDG